MGKGSCRSRVRQIIRRHIDGLHRGDRSVFRGRDPLLQLSDFIGQRRLIADGRRHAAKQCRHLGTCLYVAENIIDEQQHILMLPVSEIFCHRKTGLRHSHTGSRRFVHLPEHEGCLVNNPGFIHLCPQVISLPGAFSHPGKNRISAVFRGDVMDQLLNQHRFTHSGTAEQSDFTAFCIRCQEVDDFDSCLQDLYDRALLLKCRRNPCE